MTDMNPIGYIEWFNDVKLRIREAQLRAAVAVNAARMNLYWSIGKDILDRQATRGWGTKVVDKIATDLRKEFPEMTGFSRTNLMYMRAFAEAWPIVPQAVGQLAWGHNRALLDKIDSAEDREWYANATINFGWGRDFLIHQIETRAHERQGMAITNFKRTLPEPQSELAQQLFKDPMQLDFLTLGPEAKERDLEDGLINHLQAFLLELGKGFAFMGRQYHLEVGGQDYYLDLLFFNTTLNCHIVIELKITDFKPEYVGKMQFYLAAVDENLRSEAHGQSIGLILCKTKNGLVAEYALRDSGKPIGVAEYKVLPPKLANVFPSIEELEAEFSEGIDQLTSHQIEGR